jgi:hypothetical protein
MWRREKKEGQETSVIVWANALISQGTIIRRIFDDLEKGINPDLTE